LPQSAPVRSSPVSKVRTDPILILLGFLISLTKLGELICVQSFPLLLWAGGQKCSPTSSSLLSQSALACSESRA
jgi:hypothetical protein